MKKLHTIKTFESVLLEDIATEANRLISEFYIWDTKAEININQKTGEYYLIFKVYRD